MTFHRTRIAVLAIALAAARGTHAQAVSIETVTVGNPGNPGESQTDGTFGDVDYVYRIGQYEVTAGQYTAFLNAVAAADTYSLYNIEMWTDDEGAKIERTGSSGSYTYSVAPDRANRPVNFVSFGDALRFANWLHNNQPVGAQDMTTTEDGSYFLDGAQGDSGLEDIAREPDAMWVVPSEDEWYKAAYHANDGVTGNYFNYPMSCDLGPSNVLTDPDPDPGCHATYHRHPNDTIGAPYFRTEVGAHENSASPYGTFDQGGNVAEWNESIPLFNGRGQRGGAYLWGGDEMAARTRPIEYHSSDQFSDIGFRVVLLGEQFVPGDADGDGDVDLDDYNIMSGNMYTATAGGASDGDFNDDGMVDFEDFVIQALNFGDWPSAESLNPAPEPGALSLLAIGALALRRRRK